MERQDENNIIRHYKRRWLINIYVFLSHSLTGRQFLYAVSLKPEIEVAPKAKSYDESDLQRAPVHRGSNEFPVV